MVGHDSFESCAESHRILTNVLVHPIVIGFVLVSAAAPALAGHDKTDVATIDGGST
jgi:hypothetical protein